MEDPVNIIRIIFFPIQLNDLQQKMHFFFFTIKLTACFLNVFIDLSDEKGLFLMI